VTNLAAIREVSVVNIPETTYRNNEKIPVAGRKSATVEEIKEEERG